MRPLATVWPSVLPDLKVLLSALPRPGASVVNELPKEGATAATASVVLLFQPPSLSVTRNLFYKGQMEFQLVLSLTFQYTFLTAFGQKRLVSYLAVPYKTYCV